MLMLLFAYFDGATGPVQPVGWTNYDEDYAATECARQVRRERWPYGDESDGWAGRGLAGFYQKAAECQHESAGSDWLRGFQERCEKLAELCEAMRKATESKP